MLGFLLFSAVVLSAVDVGSSITISYELQEYVWSYSGVYRRCQLNTEPGYGICGPEIHSVVTIADNNRVVSGSSIHQSIYQDVLNNQTLRFWDVIDDEIQIPIFLRVVATVDLTCAWDNPFDNFHFCVGTGKSANASVLQLIKVPKFSGSFQHFEVQLPLDKTFDISIFLIVNISGMTEGSDCVDIGSDKDFCPKNQPYSCPMFKGEMTNPCCSVDINSGCMLRNESNIKTTTTTTTTTTTPTTTTTVPTTTTTTFIQPTSTTTTSQTTTISTTSTPTSTFPTTSTTAPTTPITTTTTVFSPTTIVLPTTAVKTDSPLTTTANSPPQSTPTASTESTPTISVITTTTYQDSSITTQVATAADTTATTTSRENPESTLSTTAKKLCTPATTTIASETVEDETNITTPCHENVYFWVMIEFILLTAILLISLIFITICNPRRESQFVEEDESEEENPQ